MQRLVPLVNAPRRLPVGPVREALALLREALPGADCELAHGHDRATGGSLAPDEFERLLSGLGLR